MPRLTFLLTVLALFGCGPDAPIAREDAAIDGGDLDGARLDGSRDGATDGRGTDAATDGAVDASGGCEAAGGVCGCAGGCNPGFHPAPSPLLDMCPQPCDGCGACSQWCCLPDDAGTPADAGVRSECGTETCGASELCIRPCCGGAPPPCLPTDGVPCAEGSTACTLPDGRDGCQTPCTPPPPYCDTDIPTGCTMTSPGEVICVCA